MKDLWKRNSKQSARVLFNNLGDLLTKINFTSKGKKEHFYKVLEEKQAINVYEKLSSNSPYRIISLNEITKICYGISSDNVKKKFKNVTSTNLKNPWLFLSIVTPARSTDLYMEENTLNTWFYGLRYYLRKKNMSHKIISVNNFVLTKLKLKLIYKIGSKKTANTENAYKNLVSNIAKEKQIQNLSFAKILLLYIKLENPKI